MKIDRIWEELESDSSFSHGLLLRRYSGAVLPDVFVALQAPENYRCITASVSSSARINLSTSTNLKDISFEFIPDENKPERAILLFKLLSHQHKDIFSVLCEDLITSISNVTDEAQLVRELLNRFEKWKSLFDRASSQELSPQEQRGLFGELLFIRKCLRNSHDHLKVINSWVGCEKGVRDFQSGTWSVEVKTTSGNDHQKIQISSERQLDTSNLQHLFLYHLSLEVRNESGETLNQIVESILEILGSNYAALNRFKNKLLAGGYFDHHRQLYESTGYYIRGETLYRVQNSFPRIEEKDVRKGVGEVKYSITTSGCSDFAVQEQEVFQTIDTS